MLLKRLWLFLLVNALLAWLAYRFVLASYPTEMTILFGVLLCIYALSGFGLKLPAISVRHEWFSATVCGAINGFFAGTTGNTSMPSVAFLSALKLDKSTMVQAMGLAFGTRGCN